MSAIDVSGVVASASDVLLAVGAVGVAVLGVYVAINSFRWLRAALGALSAAWHSGPSPESIAYTAKVKAQLRGWDEAAAAEKAAEAAKSPEQRSADEAMRVAKQAKALAEWNFFRGD